MAACALHDSGEQHRADACDRQSIQVSGVSGDLPDRRAADAPRVVLDTNVSLALFAYADPNCARLHQALRQGRLCAVADAATRAEWQRVLQRDGLRLSPEVRDRAAICFDAVVLMLGNVAAAAPAPELPRCRDTDDQMFLELARDAGALALYSRDRELLKLSRRTQRQAGFRILRPEDHGV
jgi:putative PIN family toxin of toxin-antitoxin system